jgi:hypothetical protein
LYSTTRSSDIARLRADAALHLGIDVLLFSAFAAHHSLFTPDRVKQQLAAAFAVIERSACVSIASLLSRSCVFYGGPPRRWIITLRDGKG